MTKPWLYRLDQDYSYRHSLLNGIEFENTWINIQNSQLTIKKGYAWDGCTPRISIFGVVSVGVPNGILRYNKPWTYHASLVHDALCQFNKVLPISKQTSVQIFNDILKESGWPLRRQYVWAVDKFGPKEFLIS